MPRTAKKKATRPRKPRRCLIVEITPEIEIALSRIVCAQTLATGLGWTKSDVVRSLIFQADKKISDSAE